MSFVKSILTSDSYTIQANTEQSNYVVKDTADGSLLLTVVQAGPGVFSAKDMTNAEMIRIFLDPATQRMTLGDPSGTPIGNVQVGTKAIKEHKKDKYKDGGKREMNLVGTGGSPLLTMTGKTKNSVLEMKIKSVSGHGRDHDHHHDKKEKKDKDCKEKDKNKEGKHKEKDEKHKDKEGKHKDKEDKDKKHKKKGGEVGRVSGNINTGLNVTIKDSHATLPERLNIVGLLLANMEMEKSNPNTGLAQGVGSINVGPNDIGFVVPGKV